MFIKKVWKLHIGFANANSLVFTISNNYFITYCVKHISAYLFDTCIISETITYHSANIWWYIGMYVRNPYSGEHGPTNRVSALVVNTW